MQRSPAIAALGLAAAFAGHGAGAADFTDVAPVVASTPIYESVNAPRQECWNEQVTTQTPGNGGSALGAIVGGIAGGVLGHQVGGGRGNAVATGVGAVAGAVIGDKVDPNGGVLSGNANAGTSNTQVVQRCRTVDGWQEVIRGYNVTYRYGGHDVTVRLPYDPGPNVHVAVGVVPDRRPPVSYNAPPPPGQPQPY
jgi:uncharacterized protein YcfJ